MDAGIIRDRFGLEADIGDFKGAFIGNAGDPERAVGTGLGGAFDLLDGYGGSGEWVMLLIGDRTPYRMSCLGVRTYNLHEGE